MKEFLPTNIVGDKDLCQHILLAGKTSTNRCHGGNDLLPTNVFEGEDFVSTYKFLGQDLGATITTTNRYICW